MPGWMHSGGAQLCRLDQLRIGTFFGIAQQRLLLFVVGKQQRVDLQTIIAAGAQRVCRSRVRRGPLRSPDQGFVLRFLLPSGSSPPVPLLAAGFFSPNSWIQDGAESRHPVPACRPSLHCFAASVQLAPGSGSAVLQRIDSPGLRLPVAWTVGSSTARSTYLLRIPPSPAVPASSFCSHGRRWSLRSRPPALMQMIAIHRPDEGNQGSAFRLISEP